MPVTPQSASATARHGLPWLFTGQSQKEAFVNESFGRLDLLLHPAIEGTLAAPPADPAEGEAWLVDTGAQGAWAGHDGKIAGWQGGQWLFLAPVAGQTVLDKSCGASIRYMDGWQRATMPPAPEGGTGADSELRTAFAMLLTQLAAAGIIFVT